MEIYKIRNLSFSYPDSEKKAIDGISLSINSGEFVTVCGVSGSGKTTLIKHLKPVCTPRGEREGEVFFCGRELFYGGNTSENSAASDNIKIGFVTQNTESRTVTDKVWHELSFAPENMGLDNCEIRARVAETAAFFGLSNIFHKDVSELSGGQLRLLNIASVMTMQPEVLILDEPTSSLDPIAARELLETLSHLNRETGITVIISEHRLEDAFAFSDRVIVLEDGKITADANPRGLSDMLRGHSICAAMPAAMRIYMSAESSENTRECPVSVRDGRRWLNSKRESLIFDSVPIKDSQDSDVSTAIELKDVFFRYKKELPDVINGLSFKIHSGEFFALCGANGTGKSTFLSVISGAKRPYSGKIKIFGISQNKIENLCDGCIGVLPQNPKDLFVKRTVRAELEEMLENQNLSSDEKSSEVEKIARVCDITQFLERHPNDLSGGEQHRAALAKVLLTKPRILLLDEPTTGMDALFKIEFAKLLKKLSSDGVTIVMVSHDLEFCAEYADRAAIFFDGAIIADDIPRKLFGGKSFYTTAASRISRGIIENAVTVNDVVSAFGKEYEVPETSAKNPSQTANANETANAMYSQASAPKNAENTESVSRRITTIPHMICGALSAVLFVIFARASSSETSVGLSVMYQLFTLLAISACLVFFLPRKKSEDLLKVTRGTRRGMRMRTAVCIGFLLLCIPLTALCGSVFLNNKKYYFISLLIMLEILFAFALYFEGRKPHARELVTISVLCAIGIAGRTAFYPFQQFKPVAAVTIIAGVCLGGETGFLVGAVCAFVSNFFFGQGPWTPWQMTAFGMIGFFAGLLFNNGIVRCTKIRLCIYGAISVMMLYGGIMNPATVVLQNDNPSMSLIFAAYLSGMPFDAVHAASTAFFLWFGAETVIEEVERIKTKYGFE